MRLGVYALAGFLLGTAGVAHAAKEYEEGGKYNNCIAQSKTRYGGIEFRNICSEALYMEWREAGPGMMGWNLAPGGKGGANTSAVGGYAVCRAGFSPVDANDHRWNGYGQFRCRRYR